MKIKELLALLLLGLAVGGLVVWNAIRHTPEGSSAGQSQTSPKSSNEPRVDPKWASLNPTEFDRIAYVDEKTFPFDGESQFRPREALPLGKVLSPGRTLTQDLLTDNAVLGLVIEARASTPGGQLPRFISPIDREGVNLKPELAQATAPVLQVEWDGEPLARFPLTAKYWRLYYARVNGDGKRHEVRFRLELPAGAPPLEAAVKRVALFSQDLPADEQEPGAASPRIDPLAGALRAKALDRKIIILGLDGITWKVLDPLLEQGKLPNFQALIERGARAIVMDEPPLDSPKIWTTIATGRRAEAHGIQERLVRSSESPNPVPVNSTLRRTKALWNMFSNEGRQVGFVNWFVTWPAEAVNGFMVTDRGRFETSHAVYPEMIGTGRSRHLLSESDLAIDSSPMAIAVRRLRRLQQQNTYPARQAVEREELSALVKRAEDVYFNDSFFRNYGCDLYQRYRPDLFGLYFHGTDAISHAFYKFRFPDENFDVSAEQIKAMGHPIEVIYRFHDDTLGRLMEIADPETTWVILSDHGFQAQAPQLEKIYIYNLDSILDGLGLLRFWKGKQIDWKNAVCYTSRQLEWSPVAFLSLNLKGRETNGIVAPGQKEAKLKEIAEQLRGITLERSGRSLFVVEPPPEGRKHRGDLRVYPQFEPGDFEDSVRIGDQRVSVSEMFTIVPISGTHNIEGVLIFSGPGIKQGTVLGKFHTVDVAPTILALAGLPIGEDLDGRVIEEALEPDFLNRAPLRTLPSYERLDRPGDRAQRAPSLDGSALEIDAEILDGWRKLGYTDPG